VLAEEGWSVRGVVDGKEERVDMKMMEWLLRGGGSEGVRHDS